LYVSAFDHIKNNKIKFPVKFRQFLV